MLYYVNVSNTYHFHGIYLGKNMMGPSYNLPILLGCLMASSMEVVSEWRFQQLEVPINSNNNSPIPHILSSFTLVIRTEDQDVHGPRAGPAMYPAGCAQQ